MNIYTITMQDSLSYLILILIGVVLYLLIYQRKNKVEPKDHSQEINNLTIFFTFFLFFNFLEVKRHADDFKITSIVFKLF